MSENFEGTVNIRSNGGGDPTIVLGGGSGNLRLGGEGKDGDLLLTRSNGERTVHVDGAAANVWIGGNGADGDIVMFAAASDHSTSTANSTIHLDADTGDIRIGGGGQGGSLIGNRANGTRTVNLDAENGNLWMGGDGTDGDIVLFPASASHGTDNLGAATIHMDANAGDITLRNADCAEDFDAAVKDIEPGSVVVIDDSGRLRPSDTAYDRRVAGVISGAGCYKPALVLDRQPGVADRVPLAMVGKVICRADAESEPIRIGDLLTTSSREGYAMVASEHDRAFGAVIGKALGSLDDGLGAIPILIGLQ